MTIAVDLGRKATKQTNKQNIELAKSTTQILSDSGIYYKTCFLVWFGA